MTHGRAGFRPSRRIECSVMPLLLEHDTASLELELQGGVVTRLNIGGRHLLHSARGDVTDDPTLGSCFAMLPWCNRLSRSGVATRNGFMPRPPNWPTTPFPVHGHGWQDLWEVANRSPDHVHLQSHRSEPEGYSYIADLKISLTKDGAKFDLTVTNTGPLTLPFGIGLHPYFARNATTQLTIPARKMVRIGTDGLPTGETDGGRGLDYTKARSAGMGSLAVFYPDVQTATVTTDKESVHLRYGGAFRHLMLWSPVDLPFLCIEPMSHQIDHFSDPSTAAAHDLSPGKALSGHLAFPVKS